MFMQEENIANSVDEMVNFATNIGTAERGIGRRGGGGNKAETQGRKTWRGWTTLCIRGQFKIIILIFIIIITLATFVKTFLTDIFLKDEKTINKTLSFLDSYFNDDLVCPHRRRMKE